MRIITNRHLIGIVFAVLASRCWAEDEIVINQPFVVDINNVNTNHYGGSFTILGLRVMEGVNTLATGHASRAGGENAWATNDNTFVWSDGMLFGSTLPAQFSVYASNGYRLLGGPIAGDGSGLTNLNLATAVAGSITSDKLAIGAVTASKLATGSVGSSALATGAVTAAHLAAGSIGTNKSVAAEWNAWADARYLPQAGMTDLALNPGRLVAGYGMNLTNLAATAYGASQQGRNAGSQTIMLAAYGASQQGYNAKTQTISIAAYGASQRGLNSGLQTIGASARGAAQSGWNAGTQAIGPSAYGAEQRGYVSASACATNSGIGSVQLLNLASNQKALITGHAALGLGACMVTNEQAIVAGDGLASHGKGTVTALGFYGNGAGLTNLNLSTVAAGSITSDKLAVGSIGTNKAVMTEWNNWGNTRYLSVNGSPDLVLGEPGRIVGGYGMSVTNCVDSWGTIQLGANEGSQTIGEWNAGAVQIGYNTGSQVINTGAYGAMQIGHNWGAQSIGSEAIGALQRGYNIGTQIIEYYAYGASQQGQNYGMQSIEGSAFGASQRGYNDNVQTIGEYAIGASQVGANTGYQTLGQEAYGASQNGWNAGTQTIGSNAYGAEQRGFVDLYASATNAGIGSVQLLNLASNQKALITGHAAMGLGACMVTHDQAIVAGDGLASHGQGTVTALGFYGDGAGLTNLNLSSAVPANSVTTDKLAANAVTSAKILDGSITDADIAPGAAIASSKVAGLSTLAASVDAHTAEVNNPHQVTAVQVGAYTTQQTDAAISSALSHITLAAGSVGTNSAAMAEWNRWGDERYLKTMTNAIHQALLNVGPFGDVSMGAYTTP